MSTERIEDFGEALKRLRVAASISQEELAARAGLSAHGISDLERGARHRPRRDTIHLLADALKLSAADREAFVAAARRSTKNASHAARVDTTSATPTAAPPVHHLPAQFTRLVGREQDVQNIGELLQGSARLLTITGPGGIGKTRVGLEVATTLSANFSDGVYFIGLAAIREPDLVLSAIAQALGVTPTNEQSPLEALSRASLEQHTLLLLDNFEQVVAAAPLIGSLLMACHHLKILVTSRAALHIAGEQEYPLPPLSLPDLQKLPDVGDLAHYPAIALFLQRAQAVKPDLTLTQTNGPAVAEICVRLDGIPLAIELAAARIRILPPRALLQRLEQRLLLAVLRGGPNDAPFRHQTLQNAIAWSYELLTTQQQILFRRLAVFASGFTLEAAEQVWTTASDPDYDVLEGITSLVENNLLWLVETTESEARFGMLETIREYGLEWLEAGGEAETMRRQHANYYVALAERYDAVLTDNMQYSTLAALEQEHGNMRAALRWARECEEVELGLRLAGALARFWKRRSYVSEGRSWLSELLSLAESQADEQAPAVTPLTHMRALTGAGRLAWGQSDYGKAKAYCEASLALSLASGEKREAANTYMILGNVAHEQGAIDQELAAREECLRLFREIGHKRGIAAALGNLASTVLKQRDYQRAEVLCEESIHLFRDLDDKVDMSIGFTHMGDIARMRGDYQRADSFYAESQMLARELQDRGLLAIGFGVRGYIALEMNDFEHAEQFLREAITLEGKPGRTWVLASAVAGFGMLACGRGQPERAARWLGAAEMVREAMGISVPFDDQALYERTLATLQTALGKERFATLWAIGRTVSLARAIAEVLREASTISPVDAPFVDDVLNEGLATT